MLMTDEEIARQVQDIGDDPEATMDDVPVEFIRRALAALGVAGRLDAIHAEMEAAGLDGHPCFSALGVIIAEMRDEYRPAHPDHGETPLRERIDMANRHAAKNPLTRQTVSG